jgi:hypothetical protein
LHLLRNGVVAGGQLRVTGIKQGQMLLQRKHMLVPVMAGERGGQLVDRRVTAPIAMLRQLLRIAATRHNVADDAQPGLPGDVTDHLGELQIHLHERLRHALDTAAGQLDQRLPMPEISAERDDRVGGSKTAAEQPDDVEVAQPLTIEHVAFARGHVFEMARVDQQDLEAAGLQQFIDGDPVHARRFHRDRPNPTRGEPVGQLLQAGCERRKALDGLASAIRGHGDMMFSGATIDAGRIGIDALQN